LFTELCNLSEVIVRILRGPRQSVHDHW